MSGYRQRVTDSICTCGHFQSVHEGREEGGVILDHHGPCVGHGEGWCECERFTWDRPAHPRWVSKLALSRVSPNTEETT